MKPQALFENGSSRSETARMYHLVPREAIDAIADRMGMGFEVHGEENWKKGGPKFFHETLNHLMTHLLAYGDTGTVEEIEAVLTNAMMLTWWERKGKGLWALNELKIDEYKEAVFGWDSGPKQDDSDDPLHGTAVGDDGPSQFDSSDPAYIGTKEVLNYMDEKERAGESLNNDSKFRRMLGMGRW